MATKTKKAEGTASGAAKTATKQKVVAKPAPASAKKADPSTKKAAPRKKAASTAISQDAIALRAYYICEARIQNGQPGDSLGDWIEAERQLLAESAK